MTQRARVKQRLGVLTKTGAWGAFLLTLALGVACSDDTATDVGSSDSGTDADDASDTNLNANDLPSLEGVFTECSAASECEDDELCGNEVCVDEPLTEAAIYREEGDDYVAINEPPNLSCWEQPVELTAAPELVTAFGDLDLFGPERSTNNLCVTAYDEAVMLPWSHWLLTNTCPELLDLDLRTQEPYVNCFALDPCRCDDTEFTRDRGNAGDSLESCYAEIGYCVGIEDPELHEQCRATIRARTGLEADTLIYGFTRSVPFSDDSTRLEAEYELAGVPTNTRLVFKGSGDLAQWRDSYEWGTLIPDSIVQDGRARWDAVIVTASSWQTIPFTAGLTDNIPPENAALAGIIRDCGTESRSPERLLGARMGFAENPRRVTYFNAEPGTDATPLPGQAYTNRDGTYAAIDMVAGPNRASAIVMQNGAFVSAGQRDVYLLPLSVTIATFEGNWSLPE